MKKTDFRFTHRLRVRWAEVDMQKIVFNAHYLMYFDTAITDYWRALALPYEEAMVQLAGDLYVKKATLEYHGSARFDDHLQVALKCDKVGNSSITFSGAVFRNDALLVSCALIYVFADPATQKAVPVPPGLRQILADFEAGKEMYAVKTGSWQHLKADATRIRTEVFVDEQGIQMEEEWDEADPSALHAVVYNGLMQCVATGRLLQHAPGVAKIGRMAVKRVLRGSSLGRGVVNALMAAAAEQGYREVLLHAQTSAQGFYEKSGFTVRGAPFDEVGIAHVEMFKTIGQ
jgi:YbgC/YbaW family acyl-CoA thioester hydrolase